MSYGVDWICSCGFGNLDVRKRCRGCHRMRPPAGETIRSTQDGSMEAAAETGQSPVAAASIMPWRCFHCDEVFTDETSARLHFGVAQECEPICQVTAERYREVERQLEEYRTESDATSKTFYALGADHYRALIDAEQKGYDRGLADAKAHPETIGLSAQRGGS